MNISEALTAGKSTPKTATNLATKVAATEGQDATKAANLVLIASHHLQYGKSKKAETAAIVLNILNPESQVTSEKEIDGLIEVEPENGSAVYWNSVLYPLMQKAGYLKK